MPTLPTPPPTLLLPPNAAALGLDEEKLWEEGRRGCDLCLTREVGVGELTVIEGGDGGGSLLVTPPLLLDSVSSVAS